MDEVPGRSVFLRETHARESYNVHWGEPPDRAGSHVLPAGEEIRNAPLSMIPHLARKVEQLLNDNHK